MIHASLKISVITPSFNSAASIERAIESVIIQNYDNKEHIIVDGGSTDNTLEILSRYKHLIWISEKDGGQSDAMNKGFLKSSGDLIVYLNADDEFYPGWFSEAIKVFGQDPTVDMVVGKLAINRLGSNEYYEPATKLHEILDYRKFRFPLNPISYVYKRTLQEKVGPFPMDNHYSMDYWFLLRAYLFGKIRSCDYLSGVFNITGQNKTSDSQTALVSLAGDFEDFKHQFEFHFKYWHANIRKRLLEGKQKAVRRIGIK